MIYTRFRFSRRKLLHEICSSHPRFSSSSAAKHRSENANFTSPRWKRAKNYLPFFLSLFFPPFFSRSQKAIDERRTQRKGRGNVMSNKLNEQLCFIRARRFSFFLPRLMAVAVLRAFKIISRFTLFFSTSSPTWTRKNSAFKLSAVGDDSEVRRKHRPKSFSAFSAPPTSRVSLYRVVRII